MVIVFPVLIRGKRGNAFEESGEDSSCINGN